MPTAPTLTGPRLRLRPWRDADAPALEPACGDPDICRITTVPVAYSLRRAQEWVARQRRRVDDGTAVVLAIELPDRDLPVGTIGVFGLGGPQRDAQLGYWVVRGFRGRALARDAAHRVAGWAFAELGLDALHLDIEPHNVASQRIAQRLGARPAGHVRITTRDGAEITLDRHTVGRG